MDPSEPSDFDNETEEVLQDVESEEEPMVESNNSDTSSVSLAALPFVASAAQQRIGTRKEPEGD